MQTANALHQVRSDKIRFGVGLDLAGSRAPPAIYFKVCGTNSRGGYPEKNSTQMIGPFLSDSHRYHSTLSLSPARFALIADAQRLSIGSLRFFSHLEHLISLLVDKTSVQSRIRHCAIYPGRCVRSLIANQPPAVGGSSSSHAIVRGCIRWERAGPALLALLSSPHHRP